MKWNHAYVLAWAALVSAPLLFEMYTLLRKVPIDPPLTNVITRYVSPWITLPFLCWLLTHFVDSYAHAGKI